MIRKVTPQDTPAITEIYNHYIEHTVISFETRPLSEEEMLERINHISAEFPYFVCTDSDGKLTGYCYAHPWKERAAYHNTLETTVYLAPGQTGKGIGTMLMKELIDECRRKGFHALIACITSGNAASETLHRRLGFEQVSLFKEVGNKHGRWLDVVDYELILNKQ